MSKSYPTGGYGYQEPKDAKTEVESRKQQFEGLNAFVTKHQGLVVSIPGNRLVDFWCLPESDLPDQLAALGYAVHPDGFIDAMLAHAIVERFTRTATGELEPLTEASTKPVVHSVTHAGLTRMARFWFDMKPKPPC